MNMPTSHTTTRERTASSDDRRTIELLRERLETERDRCERIALDLQLQEEQGRALLRQIASLKRELTKRERASVAEAEVQEVFNEFLSVVAVRKDVVLDDARRKMIRDRIRDIREAPNVQEEPVARLKRACHGLAKRPYVKAGGGRTGQKGNGARRFAGLQHALRDMQAVETCIGYLEESEPTPIRRHRGPDPFDRPVDKVLEALRRLDLTYKGAWGAVGKWMAQCPAHDDRQASLSIREADDRVLLNCFAGCEVTAICDALSLSLSELFVRDAA